MTGIHLLDTGEVEANLRRLNRHFGSVFLGDLIALKTVERATVDLDWKFQVAQLAEFLHVRAILVRQGFSLSDRWSVLFGHGRLDQPAPAPGIEPLRGVVDLDLYTLLDALIQNSDRSFVEGRQVRRRDVRPEQGLAYVA
jgi:hypothetical protein